MNESDRTPNVYVIGGPNGAGKTTFARSFVTQFDPSPHFVNADVIAADLSPESPEAVALQAGRLMLRRISELASQYEDFAIESTLASITLATRLKAMKAASYQVHIVYLWLDSPDLAVARVTERVNCGGHYVPDETVRRRYNAGLRNLFQRYLSLADEWAIYDNSSFEPARIAYGSAGAHYIEDAKQFLEVYGSGADCNGASSRVWRPEALPTHRVCCVPKSGNYVTDHLVGIDIEPMNLTFYGFVSWDGNQYATRPPFNSVKLEDKTGSFIVHPEDVLFKIQEMGDEV